MATINHSLIKGKDKSSVSDRNYFLCDICEFNGYPNEKVSYQYKGQRSEDEEGFITSIQFMTILYRLESFMCINGMTSLINRLVNQSLGKDEDPYYGYCGGAYK